VRLARSATNMVDYQHGSQLQQLDTVDEQSETEDDDMHGDVRSNSSTLKSCSSQRAGWTQRRNAVGVIMTESTDSGLESDKNVEVTEVTAENESSRRRRNEHWLYHCQVGLSLMACLSVQHISTLIITL